MNSRMDVTVIIPSYNRAGFLRETMQSILGQSFPPDRYEIIFIDNGSTDNTGEIIAAINAENSGRIRYVYEPRPGLLVGRHLGASLARGRILLYGDDDIIASPDWVGEVCRCYQDEMVGAASGRVLPRFEVPPPAWVKLFPETYISIIDPGDEYREVDRSFAYGCNMSVRKDVFYEVGGFNPDSMPPDLIRFVGDGETALMERVAASRYKMVYNPAAYVYHVIPAGRLTIDFYKKRAFFQGVGDSYRLIRRHGGIDAAAYADMLRAPGLASAVFDLLRCIRRGGPVFIRYYRYMKDVAEAYRQGAIYHRNEAENDPALLEWILRENYLEG